MSKKQNFIYMIEVIKNESVAYVKNPMHHTNDGPSLTSPTIHICSH